MYLCTYVSEEGGDGEVVCSETPSLLSYILRYVSFAEVVRICRTVLREPMHLCTCVSDLFICLLSIDKARAKDKIYI